MTKNNLQHHYVEHWLIYEIHAHGSISERDPCQMETTPQHNCRYIIYKHSTLLRHKVMRA